MRAWLSIAIVALSTVGCAVSASDGDGAGKGASDTSDDVELVGLDGEGNEVPVTTAAAADSQRHTPSVLGMGGASAPKTGASADNISESSDPWLSVLGPVPDPWRDDYTAECSEPQGSGKNTRP